MSRSAGGSFEEGTIELRNVDFGYRPNMPVLKNVNLTICRNSKVAILGDAT